MIEDAPGPYWEDCVVALASALDLSRKIAAEKDQEIQSNDERELMVAARAIEILYIWGFSVVMLPTRATPPVGDFEKYPPPQFQTT